MTDQDKGLWLVWAGLVLLTVISLPFLVRQPGFFASVLTYCATLFGTG